MESTNGSTISDAVETCSSVFFLWGGWGGGSVVCKDVGRYEFRCEVRWTLEVKLGDGQPDIALVGTVVRNLQGYPAQSSLLFFLSFR